MNIFQISDLHYPYQGERGIENIEKIINHMKTQDINLIFCWSAAI